MPIPSLMKLFLLVVVVCFAMLSCSSYFSHPPTFDEAVRCYNYDRYCDKFELSKQFNSEDFTKLYQTNDFRLHLPISIQLAEKDNLVPLWKTAKLFEEQPSVLFTFINMYYIFNMYGSYDKYVSDENAQVFSEFNSIHDIIVKLKKVDPQNSLPYYLEAYYHLTNNNIKEALSSLNIAEEKKVFTLYESQVFNYAVFASEYVGYPHFLSMDVALSITVSAVVPAYFTKLARIAIEMGDERFYPYINNLGKRLEENSFMIVSKNIGLYLQKTALAAEGKDIEGLEEKSKYIFKLLGEFNMQSVTQNEERLINFFQYIVDHGEIKAMEKFLRNSG